MGGLIGALLPGLINLGSKLIGDKDKQTEYAFKTLELYQTLALKLMDTKTYPWLDGLVKLAYASEAIIKGLFRPIVSAGMTGFALYCRMKGIDMPHDLELLLASAFPAWGVSRHVQKGREAKAKTFPDTDW